MNIIVCLDDKNGMIFNNRRQSRDRVVIDDIIKTVKNSKLLVNKYSLSLFQDLKVNIIVDDNFLSIAQKSDYCFVENSHLSKYADKIDSIIIYRWNRRYPADLYFDLSVSDMALQCKEEFAGFSHEKITKEVYTK